MYLHVYQEYKSNYNKQTVKFTNALINVPIKIRNTLSPRTIYYPCYDHFAPCASNLMIYDALGMTEEDFYGRSAWGGKETLHVGGGSFRLVESIEMVKPVILVKVKPNNHKIWKHFIGFNLRVLIPRHPMHMENNYEMNCHLFFNSFVSDQCPHEVRVNAWGNDYEERIHPMYDHLKGLHDHTSYLHYIPKKIVDIVSEAEMFQNKLIEQGKGEVLI